MKEEHNIDRSVRTLQFYLPEELLTLLPYQDQMIRVKVFNKINEWFCNRNW